MASSPSTLQVPTAPEEITATWLSSVLGKRITSVRINNILPGTATKVLISVIYASPSDSPNSSSLNNINNHEDSQSESLPTKLCIKGGLDPAMLAAIPWITTLYDHEVAFYTHLAGPLTKDGGTLNIPNCYWAGNGLLILEDLSSSSAVMSFGTPLKPSTLSAVFSGVEQLAALHAQTWDVKETPTWLVGQERHYEMAIMSVTENYGAVVRGQDRPVIPETLKDEERVRAVLQKYFALEAMSFSGAGSEKEQVGRRKRHRALLHGDAHVSNTYLVRGGTGDQYERQEEEKTRFLDWQIVQIGSPFRDMAYFVVGALDVQTRREKEWAVVGYYLDCLERFGGPRLRLGSTTEQDDPDRVREEYKCGILAGVGPIVCPYEMQPREWVFAMAERYAAALDDHAVLELVEGLRGP